MRIVRICVLATLLVTGTARATPLWYTGFELGANHTSGATDDVVLGELFPGPLFAATPRGTCRFWRTPCAAPGDCPVGDACTWPYAIDGTAPPYPGNAFSLRVDAPPGTTPVFRSKRLPATRDTLACFDLLLYGHCTADPATACTSDADCEGGPGSCRGPLDAPVAFAFESPQTGPQCVMAVGCHDGLGCNESLPALPGTQRLRVSFAAANRFECGGSTVDGKQCRACGKRCWANLAIPCTTNAGCLRTGRGLCVAADQCPDPVGCGPADGAFCARAEDVISDRIRYGQWTHVCLRNTHRTDLSVACTLYRDRVEIGGATHRFGACAGGAAAGAPCGEPADCPAGTCRAPAVAPGEVGTIAFGSLAASRYPLRYRIDNLAVFDLAADPGDLDRALNRRWQTLQLAADHAPAVARSGCAEAHACLTDTANGGRSDGDRSQLTLPPDTPAAQFDLAAPVLAAGERLDSDAWLSSSCAVRKDGGGDADTTVRYALLDAASASLATAEAELDDESTAPYQALPPVIAALPGAARSWSTKRPPRLALSRAGDDDPAAGVRVTTCNAQLAYTLPPAAAADPAWLDVNGDGARTVTYANDSRWVPPALADTLLAEIPHLTNLVSCANSLRLVADFTDNAAAIADGTAYSASLTCLPRRGRRANADVLFFDAGANDLSYPAREEGTCFQPWCAGDPSIRCALDEECGTHGPCGGPQHLAPCDLPAGYTRRLVTAVVPLRCVRGIRAGENCHGEEQCSYCAGAPAESCANALGCRPGTGPCRIGTPLGLSCNPEDLWCQAVAPGINDSSPQCPDGVCVQRPSLDVIEGEFRRAVELWRARSGSEQVRVVLAPTYPPKGAYSYGCQADAYRSLAAWVRQYAEEQGLAWIDQGAYLDARAPNRDPSRGATGSDAFLIDPVHLGDAGAALIGQAMSDCLLGRYDPAMDCRPLLRACATDRDCPAGARCAGWPTGTARYCRIDAAPSATPQAGHAAR